MIKILNEITNYVLSKAETFDARDLILITSYLSVIIALLSVNEQENELGVVN